MLAFAILFLMKPTYLESGETTTLGRQIAGFFNKARKGSILPKSGAEIAQQDRENIDDTKARMEAVVSRLLQLGTASDGNERLTIASLRSDGLFTKEQTEDAWGNDFFITDRAGDRTLVAPGRDGRENTDDDFELSLDGSSQKIPTPLSPHKELNQ